MTHRFTIPESSRVPRLLTCVMSTAAMFALAMPAGAEPFEMRLHDAEIFGAEKVESGNYDEAIRRLNRRLGGDGQSWSIRTPVLIDLCVAHTMVGDYEAATKRCNEAVETGWYSGLARNNRAVLWISMGRYEDAVKEFQAALESRGAQALAKRNLERATTRLAAVQKEGQATRLAAAQIESTGQ